MVIIDAYQIASNAREYRHAIKHFSKGFVLQHEGIFYQISPDKIVTCGVLAPTHKLNESEARICADRVVGAFENLRRESTEFSDLTEDHAVCVFIWSPDPERETELYQVIEGDVISS